MKIPPARAEAFLRRPDPDLRAVLLFGPEVGLVAERGDRLVRQTVAGSDDPLAITVLRGEELGGDVGRLAEVAASPSLMGGRRAIRLRQASDKAVAAIKLALDGPIADALLVIEAADLPPRSPLRRLFEDRGDVAALGCYADSPAERRALIAEALAAGQVGAPREVVERVAAVLAGDRGLARQELEKLTLYAGRGGRLSLEDVDLALAADGAASQDDLAFAIGDGAAAEALAALDGVLADGASEVAVLRGLARHFQRLALVQAHRAAGKTLDQAMKALWPPVFFRTEAAFRRQVEAWPMARLATALERLTRTEAECKRTGAVPALLTADAVLALCQLAGR